MSALRRVAFGLALFLVAGCGGSGSKNYTAIEVRDALRDEGFPVEILSKEEQGGTTIGLLELFSGEGLDDLEDVVSDEPKPRSTDGTWTGDGVVEAWVFRSQRADAASRSCGDPDPLTTCLEKRNVVVIVNKRRATAARAALDGLD